MSTPLSEPVVTSPKSALKADSLLTFRRSVSSFPVVMFDALIFLPVIVLKSIVPAVNLLALTLPI